jgi:transposase, IS5 family
MTKSIKILKNKFGEIDISEIKFDSRSRDDIPKILKGLQYIYINQNVRDNVFEIINKEIFPEINKIHLRMSLWKIFVMGVLRLDLNYGYDQLQEMVNSHLTIRKMLGHSGWSDSFYYELQTIKDNVSLLTPLILEKINQVILESEPLLIKRRKRGAAWAVRLLST